MAEDVRDKSASPPDSSRSLASAPASDSGQDTPSLATPRPDDIHGHSELQPPRPSSTSTSSGALEDDADHEDDGDRSRQPSAEPGPGPGLTLSEQERLEWQSMLASVLRGDVLSGEKIRLAHVSTEKDMQDRDKFRTELWYALRATQHGISLEAEKVLVEQQRAGAALAVEGVRAFQIPISPPIEEPTECLRLVDEALDALESVQSAYPTHKAFQADPQAGIDDAFLLRRDALRTFSTLYTRMHGQISAWALWTQSTLLDVESKGSDGTTLLERCMRENSVGRHFEFGLLASCASLQSTAYDARFRYGDELERMNLPAFGEELYIISVFPMNFIHSVLRLRLGSYTKPDAPALIIVEEMLADYKSNLSLICRVKRSYDQLALSPPTSRWLPSVGLAPGFEETIKDAIVFFFRLLQWKLESGPRGGQGHETTVLDGHWETLHDVASAVPLTSLIAEKLCSLTSSIIVWITDELRSQVWSLKSEAAAPMGPLRRLRGRNVRNFRGTTAQSRADKGRFMSGKSTKEELLIWYSRVLESASLRYRKLLQFGQSLRSRFSVAAEYTFTDESLSPLIQILMMTDHFLVYIPSLQDNGTYIIASPGLAGKDDVIRKTLMDAFTFANADDDNSQSGYAQGEEEEEPPYLIAFSPGGGFLWQGQVLMFGDVPLSLRLPDNRLRLIVHGNEDDLHTVKDQFRQLLASASWPESSEQGAGEATHAPLGVQCVVPQRAHLRAVNQELKTLDRVSSGLAETVILAVEHVRETLRGEPGWQPIVQNWYLFASDPKLIIHRDLDRLYSVRFSKLLTKLAMGWVSFIADECDHADRRTFRWTVSALEFLLRRTYAGTSMLQMSEDEFRTVRMKVGMCITGLVGHYDILGARTQADDTAHHAAPSPGRPSLKDRTISSQVRVHSPLSGTRASAVEAVAALDRLRAETMAQRGLIGHVLEHKGDASDKFMLELAGLGSQYAIRWQQGRVLGSGASGTVYLAQNLDTGEAMAVKEIKYRGLDYSPKYLAQIKDELRVMEVLQHPNIVDYYGVNVHRTAIYIFEEYCSGGSLADLIASDFIRDETILQLYTLQLLEGVAYLHARGICHRDIKPQNVLLDVDGQIKIADFGAANAMRSQQSIHLPSPGMGGANNQQSLVGTPMYLAPEMINGRTSGKLGAMDIWSLGCVVLECVTGRKPWADLDNSWAIMYAVGQTQASPALPAPTECSELGIDFIRQCLRLNAAARPTAAELLKHAWIVDLETRMAEETGSTSGSERDHDTFIGEAQRGQAMQAGAMSISSS